MGELSAHRGRIVQRRATRAGGWTKERRLQFLELLATSCNVNASAAAAGMTFSSAYQLRRRDGEFARLWDVALATGYVRLEAELMQRALGAQIDPDNPEEEVMLERAAQRDAQGIDGVVAGGATGFDVPLAIKMLAQYQARIDRRPAPPHRVGSSADTDAALERKLAVLARGMGAHTGEES